IFTPPNEESRLESRSYSGGGQRRVAAEGRRMNVAFYVFAAVAVVAGVMTVTRLNAMHALLHLIVALLALASVFFVFGAPFAALLEVIVYAGAIMVLFVFAVMMLNLGEQAIDQERQWLSGRVWIGPSILCAILLA